MVGMAKSRTSKIILNVVFRLFIAYGFVTDLVKAIKTDSPGGALLWSVLAAICLTALLSSFFYEDLNEDDA